jgi:GntR family transcriptional regulator of vanillate catabolism
MSQTVSALVRLRDLILGGAFAPGERLTELAVAAQLNVSRTPLRAALAQLAAEGLLDVVSTGGYAVRGFSAADIHDALELRGVLEGTAARFAAERGATQKALLELRSIVAALDRVIAREPVEDPFARYSALNEAFHGGLVEMSGSDVLGREIARITALPLVAPSAFILARASVPDAWDNLLAAQAHHRAVVDAIEARHGSRAEALMREHAQVARHALNTTLANGKKLALIRGGGALTSPDRAAASWL